MLRNLLKSLVLVVMFSVSTGMSSCDAKGNGGGTEEPPHKETPDNVEKKDGVIRLVSYNVMTFRYKKTLPLSASNPGTYELIAGAMKEIGADVVCLNEIDKNTTRTGGVHQTEYFAKLMGDWDYIYGEAMPYQGGYYGEALVTKDKIRKKESVSLPKGEGAEPRVLVVAEMDDYVIMTTHLDHVSDAAQIAQVEIINAYVEEKYGDYKKPIFLGGDLNAYPTSKTLTEFKKKWSILSVTQPTFPSNAPANCIDYIMVYKNGAKYEVTDTKVLKRFKNVSAADASDHLPVYVDVRIDK